MPVEALKKRFVIMVGIDVVCAAVALAAIIGHVRTGQAWMLWSFAALLVAAFGAQIWFALAFLKRSA